MHPQMRQCDDRLVQVFAVTNPMMLGLIESLTMIGRQHKECIGVLGTDAGNQFEQCDHRAFRRPRIIFSQALPKISKQGLKAQGA